MKQQNRAALTSKEQDALIDLAYDAILGYGEYEKGAYCPDEAWEMHLSCAKGLVEDMINNRFHLGKNQQMILYHLVWQLDPNVEKESYLTLTCHVVRFAEWCNISESAASSAMQGLVKRGIVLAEKELPKPKGVKTPRTIWRISFFRSVHGLARLLNTSVQGLRRIQFK